MLRGLTALLSTATIALTLALQATPAHACQAYPGQAYAEGANLVVVADILSVSNDTALVHPTEVLRGTVHADPLVVRAAYLVSPAKQDTLYLVAEGGEVAFDHCLPSHAGTATALERAYLAGASAEVIAPLQHAATELSMRTFIASTLEYVAQQRAGAAVSRHVGLTQDAVRQEQEAAQVERDVTTLLAYYRSQGYDVPAPTPSAAQRHETARALRQEIRVETAGDPTLRSRP